MASKYLFGEKEIAAIEKERKQNKDKRAELRLKAICHAQQGCGSAL